MAFYTKYDLSFKSVHGVPISVEIQVDGYTGDPIVRRLGAAPSLKTQKNGRIISTSIEFLAECLVWGEFAEFYTQDPRRFQVLVGRGDDGEGNTRPIWRGYVTPEIYSEPYISAPYDVRICANDGLGELKLYDWEPVGRQTIAQTLATLLEAAGAEYSSIYSVSALRPASGQAPDFYDSVYIDLDYLAGKSYYDVLQSLLESINADIMQYGGDWVLIRETDALPKVIFPYSTAVSLEAVKLFSTGSYTSALYGVVNTIGQMGVADLWPVGYMTRSVEPAKKKLIVSAPWHFANAFDDPDMVDANAWSLAGSASIGDGITLGSIVAVLAIAYVAVALVFSNWFLPNTTIGDMDISLKTSDEVAAMIDDVAAGYTLDVVGNGFSYRTDAKGVGLSADSNAIVKTIHEDLSGWMWPVLIMQPSHDEAGRFEITFKQALYQDGVKAAVEQFNEAATPPTNATIQYDEASNSFKVKPEQIGTQLDTNAVLAAMAEAIGGLSPKVTLGEEQLLQPKIFSDDPKLKESAELASGMIKAKLTLNLAGQEVGTISADELAQFVTMNEETYEVTLDQEALNAWVENLAASYDTVESERTYTREDGKVITVDTSATPAPAAFLFIGKDGDDSFMLGCTEGFINTIDDVTFTATDAITWGATIAAADKFIFAKDDGQVVATP